MFPFGYGLSYTRFEYSRPVVDKSRMSGSDTLSVEVTVSNKGGYDGEEIVQCYLSAPQWAVGGLKQKLIGINGFSWPREKVVKCPSPFVGKICCVGT